MKVKDLIRELSQLDPEMDVLFAKSSWATSISVDAELVNGYSVGYPKKDNPLGTRPPVFVDQKTAHRVCEDGKTFLSFKSRHIKPAFYLRSKEPDERVIINKYMQKQLKEQTVEQMDMFDT